MIKIKRKKIISICEAWFPETNYNDQNSDIVLLNQVNEPIGKVIRESDTLITNLLEGIDAIESKFDKTTRYEIRKAKSLGFISTQLHENLHNSSIIKDITKEYFRFLKEKKLAHNSFKATVKYLNYFALNDNLTITFSGTKEAPFAWHVYIHDKQTTRLLYSFSHFRNNNIECPKSRISMMNRMLHYDDIVYFKQHGYVLYDWGGISEDASLKNISDFKLKFGGTKKHFYYCALANTRTGRLLLRFK